VHHHSSISDSRHLQIHGTPKLSKVRGLRGRGPKLNRVSFPLNRFRAIYFIFEIFETQCVIIIV